MECFQNLKTNKQKEKDRNKKLHDDYEKLRKEYDSKDSESNSLVQEYTQIQSSLNDLRKQKEKIFRLMKDE